MPAFAPPLGSLPVLQFCTPDQLAIDHRYQRLIDAKHGQTLVRRIAAAWDWSRCQPLIVARRPATEAGPGGLFVVDGQHRLAAAQLRGDIQVLPCVVVEHSSVASEAAAFVALNQERRPLTQFALWRAAVAAGDADACAVEALAEAADLVFTGAARVGRPGQINAISVVRAAHRRLGAGLTQLALNALAGGFEDQPITHAATLLHAIFGLIADRRETIDGAFLIDVLQGATHDEWIADFARAVADRGLGRSVAGTVVLREAYDGALALAAREAA